MTPEQRAACVEAMARAMFESEKWQKGTEPEAEYWRWENVQYSSAPYWRKKATAALDAALQAAEAAGFVLVPVEPTEEQVAAGWRTPYRVTDDDVKVTYRVMIAVRPR